jgi:hypothetical protein
MADEVIKKEERDRLFSMLREKPEFREMIKKDWRAALKEVGIDAEKVVKGELSRQEIESFAKQRAGWEIIIVIFARSGLEKIRINEAVNFEAR